MLLGKQFLRTQLCFYTTRFLKKQAWEIEPAAEKFKKQNNESEDSTNLMQALGKHVV